MRNNIIIKLCSILLIGLMINYSANLLTSKYSIFKYLKQKNKTFALKNKLESKLEKKEKLLKKINLLNNSKLVNIDLIEQETIKQLNRIPSGYYIIIE